MAEYFNGKQKRSQPGLRPHEILRIPKTIFPNALQVVVKPGHESTAQRDRGNRGWRLKSGHQAYQITNKDEDAQRRQVCRIALIAVADHFVRLLGDESVDTFHHVLYHAGMINREP